MNMLYLSIYIDNFYAFQFKIKPFYIKILIFFYFYL